MAYKNGAIPQSALKKITICANGDQGYLLAGAADAFNAMNAESERRFGVTLRATSGRCTYRSRKWQQYFWDLYTSGKGALAAVVGTSNHGLGKAFDLATQKMRKIVDRIGAKYGFAKKWSDAPTEWWHIKWASDKVSKAGRKLINASKDVLAGYTISEKRWIREFDRLKRKGKGLKRRAVLQRVMTRQRKIIWKAAQPKADGGDGKGWHHGNRIKRYKSLQARTN